MISIFNNNDLIQYIASITGCLSILCSGMIDGWPSPAIPELKSRNSTIKITYSRENILIITPEIANLFGSVVSYFIFDTIGKKLSVLICAPLFLYSWLTFALSDNYTSFVFARFISGLGDGITCSIIPMYIGEIAKPEIRGQLGANLQTSYLLGTLLINILGCSFDLVTTSYIASVVPIVFFTSFIWMPETPYYYIMKQKEGSALNSLKRLNKNRDVSADFNRIKKAINELNIEEDCLELFKLRSNRRAIFITLGLNTFQKLTGAAVINFYAKSIFNDIGIGPNFSTITYFSIMVLTCICSASIIDRNGRRPILLISSTGCCLSMGFLSVYEYYDETYSVGSSSPLKYLALFFFLLFIVSFSIGLAPIPCILLGELFNTNVKSNASCLNNLYSSALLSMLTLFYSYTKSNYGLYVTYGTFSLCSFISPFFVYYFVPETKGLNLEEIQLILKK